MKAAIVDDSSDNAAAIDMVASFVGDTMLLATATKNDR